MLRNVTGGASGPVGGSGSGGLVATVSRGHRGPRRLVRGKAKGVFSDFAVATFVPSSDTPPRAFKNRILCRDV